LYPNAPAATPAAAAAPAPSSAAIPIGFARPHTRGAKRSAELSDRCERTERFEQINSENRKCQTKAMKNQHVMLETLKKY
jgi:hypothetical protein